jgi:hypothetical protein
MKSLDQVVKKITFHIENKRPLVINEEWIKKNSPASYKFITGNSIDWDTVTINLDRSYQRKWNKSYKRKRYSQQVYYEDKDELARILNPYEDKLYTFVTRLNKKDELICDRISILLVRLAQKGNVLAVEKIKSQFVFIIDKWLKENKHLKRWRGYENELAVLLEKCIFRYRYSGTFMGYLYRTLQLSALALEPLEAYSLDDISPFTGKTRAETLIINE